LIRKKVNEEKENNRKCKELGGRIIGRRKIIWKRKGEGRRGEGERKR
jgi:hypothetical protein